MARQVKLAEADILKPIDQKRRDKIAAGLKRLFDFELNVPADEWDLLQGLLHQFQRSILDWEGYLNKGEIARMKEIATKATKLSQAIDLAAQHGLGNIVDYELAPITSVQLLDVLSLLASLDPSSPQADDAKKMKGQRFQDRFKADLQSELDRWWLRNTPFEATTEEGEVTQYSYFLGQIFRALPLEVAKSLGNSRTAVSQRQRHAGHRQARDREISDAIKKLHSSKHSVSD